LSTSEPAVQRRSGLATAVDTIVSPAAAFASLRVAPTWGWAFLIATVLGIVGSLLSGPAIMHALETSLPAQLAANPGIAQLPPDQQQAAIARGVAFAKIFSQFGFVFVPIGILLASLVQALIMLIANAATHGDGNFKKYFALSINVSIVGAGLAQLVLGIIVLVRGAGSFETVSAVTSSIPGLGLLSNGHGAMAAFLGTINIFSVWSIVLLALGMTGVGRISRVPAWVTAIIMLLLTAAFAAWGGARNG
jgi:hypothetical protein